MSVILVSSRHAGQTKGWDVWLPLAGAGARLDESRRLADDGLALERAFRLGAAEWYALARAMDGLPRQVLAHAPSVAPNSSDFGQMLAWSGLVPTLGWSVTLPDCRG